MTDLEAIRASHAFADAFVVKLQGAAAVRRIGTDIAHGIKAHQDRATLLQHIASLEGQIEPLRLALEKIRDMQPSEIAPETMPGLVHGPQLLFDNCKRTAATALKDKG